MGEAYLSHVTLLHLHKSSTLPFLHSALHSGSHPPSAACQGWISAFIFSIQPRCLLATKRRSFNCLCTLAFIPLFVPHGTQTPCVHMLVALIFSLRGLQLSFEPGCWCFCCATCLAGLRLSEPISATLEADRQAGEAFPSSRCTHTHAQSRAHNQ